MINRKKYLLSLSEELMAQPQHKIVKAKGWASDFPKGAGVYIIRKRGKVIYVGETGSIRGRMKDLVRTVNHTFRRSMGKELFSTREDYTVPSSKKRFCDVIEEELNSYFAKHITVSFLEVDLGRKELEEMICNGDAKPIHNIKVGRK